MALSQGLKGVKSGTHYSVFLKTDYQKVTNIVSVGKILLL